MKPSIGFVLVTYNQPQQTLALCRRLGVMFGDAPIAVHHDFSQSDLDRSQFPGNVRFTDKWHRTGWGTISVLNAQVACLRLLREIGDPDWSVSLSTSDYPIQTSEQILSDLEAAEVDAFFDMRPVHDLHQRFVNEGHGELAFNHPRYVQGAFNRYVALPLISSSRARRLKQPQEAWVLRSPLLTRLLTPFHHGIGCYAGDTWFTANRRAVDFLTRETPLWQKLHRHFASRAVPEEAFFHTLLGNSEGLRISTNNLRYTDWRGCYAHPRTLGREDFDRLLRSRHHFARKFPFDPALLSELDKAVAAKPLIQRSPELLPHHDVHSRSVEWQFARNSATIDLHSTRAT